MKKICFAICNLLLWFFFLTSCVISENTSPISIEENYVNQQVLLRAPDYLNTFKTKDQIGLELKYNSNNEIVFPNNYNLRIFERTSGAWVELKEKPRERYPLDDIILSPMKEMPPVRVVFLSPNLSDLGQKHLLRIYVFGDMKINDEIINIAAYTDVVLSP